jgi:hypothetical protein
MISCNLNAAAITTSHSLSFQLQHVNGYVGVMSTSITGVTRLVTGCHSICLCPAGACQAHEFIIRTPLSVLTSTCLEQPNDARQACYTGSGHMVAHSVGWFTGWFSQRPV